MSGQFSKCEIIKGLGFPFNNNTSDLSFGGATTQIVRTLSNFDGRPIRPQPQPQLQPQPPQVHLDSELKSTTQPTEGEPAPPLSIPYLLRGSGDAGPRVKPPAFNSYFLLHPAEEGEENREERDPTGADAECSSQGVCGQGFEDVWEGGFY
jgi:hypothetical protein